MDLISDIFLLAGTLGAALYCVILSRRLKKFNDLEKGVGGAVAVMSAQVDDMTTTLQNAQQAAVNSTASLHSLTERAETAAKQLEILVASLHDLPVNGEAPQAEIAPKESVKGAGFFHRSGAK